MVRNYNEVFYKNRVLESERLILRRFCEDDAADILEYASDSEVVRWLVWEGLSTMEEARAAVYNVYLSQNGYFAIELKKFGKCIGAISIRLVAEHDKANFGFMLNRMYWGKSYMAEALSACITFCFEKLDLNRVEAQHYAVNPSSGRVMEKAGMLREGMAMQSVKIKGIMQDCVQYGLTKDTYLAKRRDFH